MYSKVFDRADTEWLDFVLTCRASKGKPHDYDIVIGPTADDDTTFCINNYHESLYGNPETPEAKQTLLRNLEVENLGIQVPIEYVCECCQLENEQGKELLLEYVSLI